MTPTDMVLMTKRSHITSDLEDQIIPRGNSSKGSDLKPGSANDVHLRGHSEKAKKYLKVKH